MVKLPKIECFVRTAVRPQVYRAAFQPQIKICTGFLIGTRKEDYNPVFDTALICASINQEEDFARAIGQLEAALPACRTTAEYADAEPLGLFLTGDSTELIHSMSNLGALIDLAREIRLTYVAKFSTFCGESNWGISLYCAGRFPHEQLDYRMIGKRSERPNHNPRRIKSFWEKSLKETIARKLV